MIRPNDLSRDDDHEYNQQLAAELEEHCDGAIRAAHIVDNWPAVVTPLRMQIPETVVREVAAKYSRAGWDVTPFPVGPNGSYMTINKPSQSQVGIYRYSEEFGRMGDLSGVFIAKSEDVSRLMGKTVHLGEVLGKHSDVHATISEDTIKLVSTTTEIVKMFNELGLRTGVNPLEYIEDKV